MRYDFCHTQYADKIVALLMHGSNAADSLRRAGHDAAAQALETLVARSKTPQSSAPNPTDTATKNAANDSITTQNPALTAEVFKAFAVMLDPTHNRSGDGKAFKYLHWICASYLTSRHNGAPIMVEDFYKIRGNLNDFETWSARLYRDQKPNQIDDPSLAGGYDALQKLLTPYQRHREEKQIARQERVMSDDDKKRLQTETTVLYSGAEGKIVLAHSWHATKHWGNRTTWCITQRGTDAYFNSYNQKSPIIIYLPNPTPADYAATEGQELYSFKFAAVEGDLWNETDKRQTSGFPPCLHHLAKAAARDAAAICEPSNESKPTADSRLTYLKKFGAVDAIMDDANHPDGHRPVNKEATPLCDALTQNAPQEWADHAERLYRAVLDQAGTKDPAYDQAVTDYLQARCPDLALNRDFMRFIVLQHPLLLTHIPPQFKDDKPLALALPEKERGTSYFEAFPEYIRHDREVVTTWAQKTAYVLDHTSLALRADKAIIELAMQGWGNALEYAFPPQSWRKNSLSNLFAFYTQPLIQGLPNLRNDRDLVIKAVRKQGGYALKHASPRLKNDADIVDIGASCYEHASRRLRLDKERTRKAVLSDATLFQYAPRSLKKDPEFILSLLAAKASPRLCEYVHKSVLSDPDFITKAVAIHGDCLLYSKAPLTEELLFEAVKTSAQAFRMRHKLKPANAAKLSYDEEKAEQSRLLDIAVAINGHVIGEVSESQLSDANINTALTNAPLAVNHLIHRQNYRVSSVFQDRDLMLSVIQAIDADTPQSNGMAAHTVEALYRHLPDYLKTDAEVAWHAAEKSPKMVALIPPRTPMRAQIILNAALQNPSVLTALDNTIRADKDILAGPYTAQRIINHYIGNGRSQELIPYLRLFQCLWGDAETVTDPLAAQRRLNAYAGPELPDAKPLLAAAPKPPRYERNTFYI